VVVKWRVSRDIVTAAVRLWFVHKACKLLHVSILKVIFRQEFVEGRCSTFDNIDTSTET
jgi:hypothetical protein